MDPWPPSAEWNESFGKQQLDRLGPRSFEQPSEYRIFEASPVRSLKQTPEGETTQISLQFISSKTHPNSASIELKKSSQKCITALTPPTLASRLPPPAQRAQTAMQG